MFPAVAHDASSLPLRDVPAATHEILSDYLDSRFPEVTTIGSPVAEAAEHLRSFVLGGGKRIRPLYGWAGFLGAGGLESGEDPEAVLRAVSALEFIQACALIHDDIIDSSDTRRGSPTVHRRMEHQHRREDWLGASDHFGRSVAILIGDLALTWAEDMLNDSGLSDAALRRTRTPWRAMRTEVIGGQILDISLEATASEDIALAESVNRFKTAAYTIERPLHLGAAIADAPEEVTQAFRHYGREVGIAFQLRDDVLGIFGDPSITGKPSGDDLREGKRTVLLALALAAADERDPAAAARLRGAVGTHLDDEELARMTGIIEASGALDEVERRIHTLVESGIAHLNVSSLSPEVRTALAELAVRSTERRK
ncbi:polyprenyl synthetase family protein [Corynebacterium lowii]|uniref:(2E,6E)-farnesyl diphosphate synthase n=1 Tax=Corynebacterium lowii TaxID=1544413 RepID=A0A0N8W0I2_9CORY|nr:polyprenyl synthetase family protein [Corynebacterium lowii]KQB86770.1 (2E,6E)-farnesyl diphosphate synthase [Corynebacterium lowii]